MDLLFFVTAIVLLGSTQAQLYQNCDYYQELKPGENYYIYSPGYKNNYRPGTSCRWYAVSPPRSQIYLMCETFNIPSTPNCEYNRLSISPTGDIELRDATNYCGTGGFQYISTTNRTNIALLTSRRYQGGNFLCNIGVQVPPPEPTTTEEPWQDRCYCGWTNQMRIVGGTEAGVNEFPMMAGMIDSEGEAHPYCGATIISKRYTLTAAHCLIRKKPENLAVLVGDHDVSSGADTNYAALYRVDLFKVHPDYSTSSQANDLALVRVNRDIQFSSKVGPVCLPIATRRHSFANEEVTAIGWGTTDYGGLLSTKLLKVNLGVLNVPDCQTTYGTKVTDRQICTFKEDKDACQSDSGGPLLWRNPNTGGMELVGIISYGIHCASKYPGVNTRVTAYLDWIQQNTGDDFCVMRNNRA